MKQRPRIGQRVAARATLAGTHSGAGLGVEGWNGFDLLGFYAQLRLVERPRLAVTPIRSPHPLLSRLSDPGMIASGIGNREESS